LVALVLNAFQDLHASIDTFFAPPEDFGAFAGAVFFVALSAGAASAALRFGGISFVSLR
jgi:hypothetical protein